MKANEVIDMCAELTSRMRAITGSSDVQIVVEVNQGVFHALRSSAALHEAAMQARVDYDANGIDRVLRTSCISISGVIFVPRR